MRKLFRFLAAIGVLILTAIFIFSIHPAKADEWRDFTGSEVYMLTHRPVIECLDAKQEIWEEVEKIEQEYIKHGGEMWTEFEKKALVDKTLNQMIVDGDYLFLGCSILPEANVKNEDFLKQ